MRNARNFFRANLSEAIWCEPSFIVELLLSYRRVEYSSCLVSFIFDLTPKFRAARRNSITIRGIPLRLAQSGTEFACCECVLARAKEWERSMPAAPLLFRSPLPPGWNVELPLLRWLRCGPRPPRDAMICDLHSLFPSFTLAFPPPPY